MELFIQELLVKYPILVSILAIGGTLVVSATAYVALTPTKSDDAFVEKIKAMPIVGLLISYFEAHSLVERKKQDPK